MEIQDTGLVMLSSMFSLTSGLTEIIMGTIQIQIDCKGADKW